MDSSSKRRIITGGLRTLAAAVPGGSCLAQAWNEVESHRVEGRLNELISDLRQLAERCEDRLRNLESFIQASDEFPALLETTVDRVIAEPSEVKRHLYALALMNGVVAGEEQSYDNKLNVLLTLEFLTEADLQVLRHFAGGRPVMVDHLLGTSQFATFTEDALDKQVGPIVLSLSKLDARGVLSETTPVNSGFSWSGDAQYGANRWRRRTYQLTPFGQAFLQAITDNTASPSGKP